MTNLFLQLLIGLLALLHYQLIGSLDPVDHVTLTCFCSCWLVSLYSFTVSWLAHWFIRSCWSLSADWLTGSCWSRDSNLFLQLLIGLLELLHYQLIGSSDSVDLPVMSSRLLLQPFLYRKAMQSSAILYLCIRDSVRRFFHCQESWLFDAWFWFRSSNTEGSRLRRDIVSSLSVKKSSYNKVQGATYFFYNIHGVFCTPKTDLISKKIIRAQSA